MTLLLLAVWIALLGTGIVFTVLTLADELEKKNYGVPYYLGSLVFFLLFLSFTTIDTGHIGVVTRFGQVVRTIEPGAHLITPFIERADEVSIKTLVVKPNEGGSSNDLQLVTTQVTLAYHFDPKYIGYIYSNLIDSSDNAVENKVVLPAIIEAVKATTAQYTAQQLITERPKVRDGIEAFVKSRIAEYHIVAETVSITDFAFSKEFNEAIESKVTAQQRAEQASNDLARIKIEADQKVAAAQGEAAALRAQKEQVTPELLQLRTIEMMAKKWDGKLPENYYGGTAPLPMMEVFKKKVN